MHLILTIDEAIQHFTEKALDTVQADTQADRVMAIVMNPKTGDILAMDMTLDYNPNHPRVPSQKGAADYVGNLSEKEKLQKFNEIISLSI